ncbi:hypothetical protein TUSST3_45690 [Streptomyces sp. TUS-ST3]|nr:hypothetical protein TUSST3_45690 [Streptomyces sp. TUS-ST3]
MRPLSGPSGGDDTWNPVTKTSTDTTTPVAGTAHRVHRALHHDRTRPTAITAGRIQAYPLIIPCESSGERGGHGDPAPARRSAS